MIPVAFSQLEAALRLNDKALSSNDLPLDSLQRHVSKPVLSLP